MLNEVIAQMRQARQHVDQATALLLRAMTELELASKLIQLSLRGSADQAPAAAVKQTQQRLTDAQQGATAAKTVIDQTLARWGGTGGPGN
jgi:hypothetical protein